jgi:ABC-type multidrug transport system ATPase subunit
VAENLGFFADIHGLAADAKRERMASLLAFASLLPFKGRRAGELSGGMKQKLALACTLIHRPRLIFLDEPTVGVDPVARREFWSMLKSLKAEGITLVVSTPYMDEAALCDTLILLHKGEILAQGTPEGLLSAYPYRLYKVEGESTLHYPADRAPPEGLLLLYPAAGALHAVETPPAANSLPSPTPEAHRSRLLAKIKQVVPQSATLTDLAPTVEDFFIAALSLPPHPHAAKYA